MPHPDIGLIDYLQRAVREVFGTAAWPLFDAMAPRVARMKFPSFVDYAVAAALAMGVERPRAYPAAAAIHCIYLAVRLVDDILDEEPEGAHVEFGIGRTANAALALNAAAGHFVRTLDLPPAALGQAIDIVTAAAIGTARGQETDAMPAADEAGYWHAAESKSPPLFAAALQLGALLGGASADTLGHLVALGRAIGLLIQVGDDLTDALARPAGPDWRRPSNNLAILFALTAPHPDRARFAELVDHVDDADKLAEAQGILMRCGAIAYGQYQVLEFVSDAAAHLEYAALPNPAPLRDILAELAAPLKRMVDDARAAGILPKMADAIEKLEPAS